MIECKSVNVLDLIEWIGEEAVYDILSSFQCPKNPSMENFIWKNAIEFAKKKISITYLVMNMENEFLGVFTLTHKPLTIAGDTLSATTRKKLARYAKYDPIQQSYAMSAFLIAQLGKNMLLQKGTMLSGNDIMDASFDILRKVQHAIGGGVVYLECEDHPKLLGFYQNEHNRFFPFGDRYDVGEATEYIQLFRFL